MMTLKVEIQEVHGHRAKTLLSLECESPEQAFHEINKFLLKKFPETFFKLYPSLKQKEQKPNE